MSDLINPGDSGRTVPALTRFRSRNEEGHVVESTAAFPATKSDVTKYYVCTIPTASLHRADGKRLPFINGFLITNLLYDQRYLDNEIADGNPYLRAATEREVEAAKIAGDPIGTIANSISADLTDKIRAAMAKKLGVPIEDIPTLDSEETSVLATETVKTHITDDQKIAGTNAVTTNAQAMLAKIRAGQALRSGAGNGATVVQTEPLKPTSTADLGGNTNTSGA